MPLKLTICLSVLCFFSFQTGKAQVTNEKEIILLQKAISDNLYTSRNDAGMAKDGIYLLSLRIGTEKKADSVFYSRVVGGNDDLPALREINFNNLAISEKGIKYVIIPIVIVNPKNDNGDDETVLEIYKQLLQKDKGKRSGNIRVTKPLCLSITGRMTNEIKAAYRSNLTQQFNHKWEFLQH